MTHVVFSVLTCGLLLGSTSCGKEREGDTPTSREYDDIARGIAPLLSVELESDGVLETSTHIVVGDEPWWLRIQSAGNLEGSFGGLRWDVLSECWSEQNTALDVCDASTDEAQLTALVAGNLDLISYNAALDIDSKWSFDGLQGSIITALGKTKMSADSDFDSFISEANRVYEFDLDVDFDVQIPIDNYEATSGTADATVDAYYLKTDSDGDTIDEGNFVVQAELSLDGAGNAILTLDGTAQYNLNLETGVVVRISN